MLSEKEKELTKLVRKKVLEKLENIEIESLSQSKVVMHKSG